MDREEAHRYNIAAQLSNESLGSYDGSLHPHPPLQQIPHPQPINTGGFNLRWRRPQQQRQAAVQLQAQQAQAQQQQQQQQGFRGFFRSRAPPSIADPTPNPNPNATSNPNFSAIPLSAVESPEFVPASSSSSSSALDPTAKYSGPWLSPSPSPSPSPSSRSPLAALGAGARRRSGSLNSPLRPLQQSGGEEVGGAPVAIPQGKKEKEGAEGAAGSLSTSGGGGGGASWNRPGTWSQVVGKNKS